MKILHAPSDVGGQAWGLSRAERAIGYASDNILFQSNKYNYNYDRNLQLERKPLFVQLTLQMIFLVKCIVTYDVFHFYFGQSLLPRNFDLPILKLFRKKIFFTFQGCDIRLHKSNIFIDNNPITIIHECACNSFSDKRKLKKIKFIIKYADKTFALNPDLLLASPTSRLLPYAHVDLNEWRPGLTKTNYSIGTTITIAHAPSNRTLKGTKCIIKTIDKLRAQGYQVKLKLIENVHHSEIQKLCRDVDLAIDQLLIGWYGGYAVEMMALGKPVICYLDERISKFVPFYDHIPIINANPKSLYSVLENLIRNPQRINTIGIESRAFVKKFHDPMNIAKSLTNLY